MPKNTANTEDKKEVQQPDALQAMMLQMQQFMGDFEQRFKQMQSDAEEARKAEIINFENHIAEQLRLGGINPQSQVRVKKETPVTSTNSAMSLNFATSANSANSAPSVVRLIIKQQTKTAVAEASKAVPQLQNLGKNGLEWLNRMLDYLDALGLASAVKAIRITTVDAETRKEQEFQSKTKVAELRQNDDERWREAYTN